LQVIVDTSVWSLALRRSSKPASTANQATVDALKDLIADARALMIAPVRQELLSGIKDPAQFDRLRQVLKAFPDEPLTTEDYECAAQFFNQCKAHGIQGSHTDFLICSVAVLRQLPVFSLDNDFSHFQRCLPVELFSGS
jgi:predicted nucleic acid-binding protein